MTADDATPVPRPALRWQTATVVSARAETPTARTLRLRLPGPALRRPGQYYVVRLTAPDGYTASRDYSVASAPDGGPFIDLTVERLEGGEVSSFLHDVLEVGDEIEVRGPVGGWFVWDGDGPALLVGGGSGVVPLAAMLRHARRSGRAHLVHLVVSVRAPEDLYYADDLPGPGVTVVHSRHVPAGDPRPAGRLTPADLLPHLAPGATVYVCGSPGFCDHVTDLLLLADVPAERIRVERFGPSA